jgi:TRAP-type C4-dicarboxylate transport system permease small subunit
MRDGPKVGELRDGILLTHFPKIRRFEEVLAEVETVSNLVAVGLIMFLMFFASTEILGRFLFNHPVPGHVEIVELLMAAMVFLGISYTQQVDGHIRMRLLLHRIFKGRARHLAEAAIWGLSFLALAVITVGSFRFALEAYRIGDVTSYINWPTWPAKACIPIGGFLLCTRLLLQVLQHLAEAIAGGQEKKSE